MSQHPSTPSRPGGADQSSRDAQEQQAPPLEDLLADPETVVYRRRRRPNIVAFTGLGAVLGVIAAAIWTFSRPETADYSYGTVLGFISVLLGALGALAGGAVGLLLDRRRG